MGVSLAFFSSYRTPCMQTDSIRSFLRLDSTPTTAAIAAIATLLRDDRRR